jgi:cellulose biosynthesis protein BcsQ
VRAFAVSALRFARLRGSAAPALSCGLAYDRPGGPLVAVCGLAGGAGTSTLTLALARQAARESAAPILLCEADSSAGSLAAIAGVSSQLSLGELASSALSGAALTAPPFATYADGLRVIATGPGHAVGDSEQMRQVLDEARAAHGLVVVDGGVLGGVGSRAALAAATHVLFVMPATAPGVARAEQLLEAEVSPRHAVALVAVSPSAEAVRARDLRQLAERHVDRLVLVPHIAAFARGERGAGELELALAAIATALRRSA